MAKVYEYEVVFSRRDREDPDTTVVYASNKDDAKRLVESLYRRVMIKVISTKRLPDAKPQPKAGEKTPEQGVQAMYLAAMDGVAKNPLSIRVANKFMGLVFTSDKTPAEKLKELEWMHRHISNHLGL